MKWKILVEASPDNFVDAGLPVWEDGYADDGSDWGDDESQKISDYLSSLQSNDPDNRSYAASWAGL